MSSYFLNSGEYNAAVLRLGEMLYARKPADEIHMHYNALTDGDTPDFMAPFGHLCRALALEEPEAACVAMWLYCDANPVKPVSAAELLERCRVVGGRAPAPVLASLFTVRGETLILNPIAADFLAERPPRLPAGLEFLFPGEGGFFYSQGLFDELSFLLERFIQEENPVPLLLCLRGERGSGRKFLFSRLAEGLGLPVLLADLARRPSMEDMLLAAALYGSIVCVQNAGDDDICRETLRNILNRTGLAFAACPEDGRLPEHQDYTVVSRDIPVSGAAGRESMTRLLLEGVPLENEEGFVRALSAHRLNAGQAIGLAGKLRAESGFGARSVGEAALLKLLREQCDGAVTSAVRVESAASLDSLVLPPEQMRRLRELRAFAGLRGTVYETWGFGEKVAWGRGISALFYGAPGTGKTLAAAALANETGLSLMRVDLSLIMSKYIGETQKNIGKIFDEAQKCDCILFFDEADALFARRAETGDAQDKYANAETAYLLQRMEQHDGICILATNLLQNFDEAFRRRIGYMLHFPMPDAALRERIWRGIIPAEAPAEELDFAFLAEHLELSGASIKNSAVHAAYLAAMNRTEIKMGYILEGAGIELAKTGKTLGPVAAQRLLN